MEKNEFLKVKIFVVRNSNSGKKSTYKVTHIDSESTTVAADENVTICPNPVKDKVIIPAQF